MPAEPDISEMHVKVSVRHVTMGVITRKFSKSGHVGTVYDWVGSLSLTPEYFTLSMVCSMNLNPVLPIETVDQATLSMHECDESPPFPDETVCFHEFGAPLKSHLKATCGSLFQRSHLLSCWKKMKCK